MMRSRAWLGRLVGAALCVALALPGGGARAADKIAGGTLGGQAPLWPIYIGIHKGIFAAEGIDLDLTFAQSSPSAVQQLTGASLDVLVSVGITDPIIAIAKGAPLAIVRIIGQSAPYVLIGKSDIKSLKDLKGKTISAGTVSDIATYYIHRMMASEGMKPGDYELQSAGVAAARFAALQAGVAQAAMVLPPLNFKAAKLGYPTVALAADYVHDFPFTCMAVYKPWAETHKDALKRLMDGTTKGMDWLYDPANRKEAVDLLVKVGKAIPEEAEESFDLLAKIKYFERTGKVSRKQLANLIAVERQLGFIDKPLEPEALVMPGVTALAD
jgi:ABC-type nitrate/sulfonate/bicarbonate transport system substrate-binding protein